MRRFYVFRWIALGVLLIPCGLLSGCQRGASEEELGTVVHEIPKVPGSENSHPIPELNPNAKKDEPADPFSL